MDHGLILEVESLSWVLQEADTKIALDMQVVDRRLRPVKEKEEKEELGRLNLRPPCRSDKALAFLTGCSGANGLPRWLNGKRIHLLVQRQWFDPWVGMIPWRRKCQPTPAFLPGESHGRRSLLGYRPCGHRTRT